MPKKYYQMTPIELSVFMTNLNAMAEAKKAELGISNALLSNLTEGKTDLDGGIDERQATKEAASAAVTGLKQKYKKALAAIAALNQTLKGNKDAPAELIEMMGLDVDDGSLTAIIPVAPADLVVTGSSNGINLLKWKSGGNKQRTTYIIEAKIGAATEYIFVKATSKTRFEHKNQTPGVKVLYRVKAVHGDLESSYSNEAVVYN